MPLTLSESVGLSVGVLNIWHRHVNADTMHQLDVLRRQYVDESIIAYIRSEDEGMGIRVVKLDEFKSLRNKVVAI
tara:strand:+ start:2315 stop:2539 length:225 start_codon:yes stop_codon:yes gene_type:complete